MSLVASKFFPSWWRGALVPVLLVMAAEGYFRLTNVTSDALAPPSDVLAAWFSALADGSLLKTTAATLAAASVGLAIGGSLGLVLGLLFGIVPVLDRLFNLTIEGIRPIPSIALVPLALLIFGFGYRLEISVVAFATIWPVMILSREAIRGVEPCLKEVASALRLSFAARIYKIFLPAIMPALCIALRISFGIALVVAVTVEISANPIGLGSGIMQAQQTLRPDLMLMFLVWIGFVGFALNAMLVRIESRFFRQRRGP